MKKENNNYKEGISKYVSQLYRKGTIFINKEIDKYDIRYGQLMFLIALYNRDGTNQEEITERLKIDKGTTARALKKLEEEEFITRIKDNDDKRNNRIYLTQKSKDTKDDIYNAINGWNEKISDSLTKEEEEQLKNLLEKVCKNIDI